MWNFTSQPRVWQVRCFSSYKQGLSLCKGVNTRFLPQRGDSSFPPGQSPRLSQTFTLSIHVFVPGHWKALSRSHDNDGKVATKESNGVIMKKRICLVKNEGKVEKSYTNCPGVQVPSAENIKSEIVQPATDTLSYLRMVDNKVYHLVKTEGRYTTKWIV